MVQDKSYAVGKRQHPQLYKICCDMQVSVMHAFIDEGNYSDMTIDRALRMMLKDFKLPGELLTDIQG